jgi:hypothetical protein
MEKIELPSGCTILDPVGRLGAFCLAEYIYYDAIASHEPNKIEPLDVLVTVAVNSFVNSAAKLYHVHQGLRDACEPLLPAIPEDADLLDLDRWRGPLRHLLTAAVQTPGVSIPVATKVLHRKRRHLIPMLDNVVLEHYIRGPELRPLLSASQNKTKAADVAMRALEIFRDDLFAAQDAISNLRQTLSEQDVLLSPVRILEILVWTQIEPRGIYRTSR